MAQFHSDLIQLLSHAFGTTLSAHDLSSILKHGEHLEPRTGEKFWYAANSPPGIFVVLAGKARLLDSADNLIITLGPGDFFGASTLFPDKFFSPLAVRASIGLKIYYCNEQCLLLLINQYPHLKNQLYQHAIRHDLLLICRQLKEFAELTRAHLLDTISKFEIYHFEVGKTLPDFLQNQHMWLVRCGQFRHTSGRIITAGNLALSSQFKIGGKWKVIHTAELYCLSDADWQNVKLKHSYTTGENSTLNSANREINSSETYQQATPVSISLQTQLNRRPKKIQALFPSPTVKLKHWWQRVTGQFPFFEQQSAADCGVACLVMIGRYWGKQLSLNHLRRLANVNRDGSSIRGLMIAAEHIGFSPRPVKADLNALKNQRLPAIIHWQGNHFVVVYRITRKSVFIADPAIGRRTLSQLEVEANWNGYTLLLKPTTALKRTPNAKHNLWKYFVLLKPHWFVLLEILFTALVLQVLGLVTPLFTQLLLDRVVVQRSVSTLTAVGIGLLIFSVLRVILSGLRRYLLSHTGNKIDLSLVVGFINHTFQLPLSYFESRYVGDITSRIQEARKIRRFLTGEALSVLLDVFTVFIYAGFMLWYNWKMTLLGLIVVPIYLVITLISAPILRRISRLIFNAKTAERSYLIEALTGINTIKSMGIERTVRWRWEDLFNTSIKINFSGRLFNIYLGVFSDTVDAVVSSVLLWFGAWQVIQDQLTIGQLVAFNMLLGNVLSPFERLIGLWDDLQEIFVATERLDDVINEAPEEEWQNQIRHPIPPLQGALRFEQVTFRYSVESEANTIENLSFSAEPGQTIALVGRSGSGKTTISKLILGLYLPRSGRILIDDYDITSISLKSLRQQVGVVDQDTFLFGSTIRENISIGHPNATLDNILNAAQLAGADSFIQELPMKYETQIGEGGGLLSGGQRQRIAIARALLSNPRLLILDEATSNLDAESESIIQTNLNQIRQNRTTIVIAHRLSTIRNADLILVLDKGILVEKGTHSELMAKKGQYFYLNQQQFTVAQ